MPEIDHPTPPIATAMRRVDSAEFFVAMPELRGRRDETLGYLSEWRDQHTRALFGVSDGGTSLCTKRYWLASVTSPR